jgi:hypothetical protein
MLLMRARRAVLEFTLWVARPELSKELRAAWTAQPASGPMLALQRLDSARALPETRLERLRLRMLERLEVLAAL